MTTPAQPPQPVQPPSAGAAASPPATPAPGPSAVMVIPAGYRQGIITAITVLLGFSLAFWRFWGLESPGTWRPAGLAAALMLLAAVVLQIIALFRALRIEDDAVPEYRKTVRWFVASAIVLLAGVAVAMADAAIGD